MTSTKINAFTKKLFFFNCTYQSDPNEKTFWTMFSTPGRGQIESGDCEYHFERSGEEPTHSTVSRWSEL